MENEQDGLIGVMTYNQQTGRPQTMFWWTPPDDGATPPWGFSGYMKMNARTLADAQVEFNRAIEAWEIANA